MAYLLQGSGEAIRYDVDFTGWIADGVTLDDASWSTGLTVSTPTFTAGGTASATLSNAAFGQVYSVKVTGTLSTGETVGKTFVVRGGDR